MQTTSSQPRAIYYVVALQIWEYFSFYGMRALLILYLTNQLKYDDNHAYALFSAYCSLVYEAAIRSSGGTASSSRNLSNLCAKKSP